MTDIVIDKSHPEKEQLTVNYYDREAENWSASHGGNEEKSYWEKEMSRFHELLPTGKILEIGSGAGKDASALIALGYDYTGTDASKGLIRLAKKRNPGAIFFPMAVQDLDFPTGTFDGFWTAATLLHLPKNRISKVLQRIRGVVRTGGIGFISMKQGEGEKTDEKTGRWFAYYSEDEFREILEKNGFGIIETQIRPTEKDTWLVFFVRA